MKNNDGKIDIILNVEYGGYNDNENVNFVTDWISTGKNAEYIYYQEDTKLEEITDEKFHNQSEDDGNNYQMDYLKGILFSQKPFSAEKKASVASSGSPASYCPTNCGKCGDLGELLGFNDNNNTDDSYEDTATESTTRTSIHDKIEYSISQLKTEEFKRLTTDLFLN